MVLFYPMKQNVVCGAGFKGRFAFSTIGYIIKKINYDSNPGLGMMRWPGLGLRKTAGAPVDLYL